MPTIKRFRMVSLCLYADHHPPHFHIVGVDFQVLVRISDLTVIKAVSLLLRLRHWIQAHCLNYPLIRNAPQILSTCFLNPSGIILVEIIPVIDLKDGHVVHARCGNRSMYLPVNSPLCRSSDVFDVVGAFLSVFAFKTFYLADLNAITGQGDHKALINSILCAFPELIFWVDCGYQRHQVQPANYLPVLGSECYKPQQLAELADFNKNFILSLDYGSNGPLGAGALFSHPDYWPDKVIVMTLDRVGSQQGADVGKLAGYCRDYPDTQFVAAGGIRHVGRVVGKVA